MKLFKMCLEVSGFVNDDVQQSKSGTGFVLSDGRVIRPLIGFVQEGVNGGLDKELTSSESEALIGFDGTIDDIDVEVEELYFMEAK